MREASALIGGSWRATPGGDLVSRNPANPDEILWSGAAPVGHVGEAVGAAREAFDAWSATSFEDRAKVLRTYRDLCASRVDEIADLICAETGKVFWDSKGEASILGPKVDITLDDAPNSGMGRVRPFDVTLTETRSGSCWFRPHGVMAVVGPFNFPAHLPNGHIIPALAMGNTIVLKPSDKTPAVGQMLGEMLQEALDAHGAPKGVVNVIQGGADVASALVTHDDVDGILFTGSWPVGRRILESNLDRPGRIVALEMGGNNAALVMPDANLEQAAIECVRCAFITSGQRCTCTRRVIVHRDVADRFIRAVCKATSMLVVGDPRADHPVFMGPMINEGARDQVLEFQRSIASSGAEILVESTVPDLPGAFVTPGVARVDRFVAETGEVPGCDQEVFGPFLRIAVTDSFEDGLEQVNATRFGLAASIFTADEGLADRFRRLARAGCVNVNAGTAGASSKLPFGGLGISGNHRPAGAFSLDYCAYPVAGMTEDGPNSTVATGMTFDASWLS